MSDAKFLHLRLDLVVEVADVAALQAAALASRAGEIDVEQVNGDPSGAAALRWLITSDDVLGLIGTIDEVEPVEAMLEVGPSDGALHDPADS
ncbi:MAG: hypothetical protein ABIS86_06765 [Streptosporangiaceae bacterium]